MKITKKGLLKLIDEGVTKFSGYDLSEQNLDGLVLDGNNLLIVE